MVKRILVEREGKEVENREREWQTKGKRGLHFAGVEIDYEVRSKSGFVQTPGEFHDAGKKMGLTLSKGVNGRW